MNEARRQSQFTVLAVGLATLVGVPIFLISIAVFEETVIGSHHIPNLYRDIGIFGPLDWLVDNTIGRLI